MTALICALLLGAPPNDSSIRVAVFAASDAAGLEQAAAALHRALGEMPPLLLGVGPPPSPTPRPRAGLGDAEALLAALRAAYTKLQAAEALDISTRLETLLLPRLDEEAACALLAAGLRLRGLVHHFVERRELMEEAFVLAAELEPSFSPVAAEWPPEARLAYSDAIAAHRRKRGGSLSLTVHPAAAAVWVDGRPRGQGSMTLNGMGPGRHYVLAKAPGHVPFATTLVARGDAQLDQVSIFLPQQENTAGAYATDLAAALGTPEEALVVRQVALLTGQQYLVMVGHDAVAEVVAWLFDATGARQGDAVALRTDGAARVRERILHQSLLEARAVVPAAPWYESDWLLWGGVGAAVLSAAVATVLAFKPSSDERVTLVLTRPP